MHAIEYMVYSTRKAPKTIIKECGQYADRNGDYKGQITGIRFHDEVAKSYMDAVNWIEAHDKGWYDNLAIKYKEDRKVRWLVKIEFHC